jgi:hypothetical protein
MKHPATPQAVPLPPVTQPWPDHSLDTVTRELLAQGKQQDATDHPAEIRAAEQELAEFKKALHESRVLSGESLLYP